MIEKPFLTKDDQTHNVLLLTNFEKLQNKIECQPTNILGLDGCTTDYHSPIISHSWGDLGHESTKALQGYPEGCTGCWQILQKGGSEQSKTPLPHLRYLKGPHSDSDTDRPVNFGDMGFPKFCPSFLFLPPDKAAAILPHSVHLEGSAQLKF